LALKVAHEGRGLALGGVSKPDAVARQNFVVEEPLQLLQPRFRSTGKIEIHVAPVLLRRNLSLYRHDLQIHFDILTEFRILTNLRPWQPSLRSILPPDLERRRTTPIPPSRPRWRMGSTCWRLSATAAARYRTPTSHCIQACRGRRCRG